jgi:pimeloyl-ACP methyl ester carboxylesterase
MQRDQQPAKATDRAHSHDLSAPRMRPFRIEVEQGVLDDLQARLERTRWASVAGQSGWNHGTSPEFLRSIVEYWRTGYDWRRHETRLNALPQFIAHVDGEDLHFVYQRGRQSRATPLVLLHGWPDSFYRYHKVIPMFADPATPGDSFDIVVPSLPGFAFTGALRHPPRQQPTRHTARLIWRLMTDVLGYDRFAVAGGDGGSVIAQILAIDHPESVIGIHLTDLGWHVWSVDPAALPKHEQRFIEAATRRFMPESAYAMVHASRPRSLAVGLSDSPVGLASWILDRFHAWSDGDLETRFGRDVLLTNIMLYWVTRTIGPSVFAYHADAESPSLTPDDRAECPVALALFPADIGRTFPPRSFAERTLAVQRWTEMPRGGHFAALEEPELLARDAIEFFRSLNAGRAAS